MPQLLCVLLGIMMIYELASGGFAMYSVNHPAAVSVASARPAPIKANSNAGLVMPFYGQYVPVNLSDMGIRRSLLNMNVVGIMRGVREEDSQVIIHRSSGIEESYSVGDTLPGGVIIRRITEDGVLVERNGELESLTFPKNELIFEPPPKPLLQDD